MAILLSSYTASLHPSDRALLTLLQRYETVAGLDLSPFQPFIFGPPAVQHYSSAGQTAWKQAKVGTRLLRLLSSSHRVCFSSPRCWPSLTRTS